MKNVKGQILVVDDEERNRRLLRQLLEAEGHRVTEAGDGVAALACVEQSPPDAILLDLTMPKMDGFEVCRRVKATPALAHIPILLVSALTAREDHIRGIDAGADDFIDKPIDGRDVVLRVRNAVYRQHLYAELQDKYRELKAMAELRDSLTRMLDADTEAMAALLGRGLPPGGAAGGRPDKTDGDANAGVGHGAN